MLFAFTPGSALPLPFVVPGAAALALLLTAGARRGQAASGVLLALGLLLPTFLLSQCLLSATGWCVNPVVQAAAAPLYVPWYADLLLAPLYYSYFRIMADERLWQRRAWRYLLPGVGQIGLFAGVAVLGLGYRHGLEAARYGALGPAGTLLGYLVAPLALACYLSLLLYGLRTLEDYRRYRRTDTRFLGSAPRSFSSQRALLVLLMLGFGLGLSFVALEAWFGPFHYPEVWYEFAVRAGLVSGLAVVGLQAGYAATAGPRHARTRMAGFNAAASTHDWSGPVQNGVAEYLPATLSTGPPPLAPAPTALPPELRPWRDKLRHLMADEQPWLEPALTLTELAHRLRTHPALLSKVINAGCGQNFNDFVNTYRVEEARRKLADPRFAHYSLVGVALESGFNSKSTFNRVFKKLLGQAPSGVMRPKS